MMHLPQLMAALLAIRQTEPLLPDSYCTPQCPSCKSEISHFDVNTSCVANSAFIVNCGSCQQCIITYGIEDGATSTTNQLSIAMIKILNLCQNSTVSTQVEALQSQASKLSVIGDYLSSRWSGDSASRAMAMTSMSSAMATGTAKTSEGDSNGGDSATMTGTATSTTTPNNNKTLLNFITPTATPLPSYPSIPDPSTTSSASTSTTTTQISRVWIAGPVAGSILGILTVLIVIFFTRRKHQRSYLNDPNFNTQTIDAKLSPSALTSPTSQIFPRSGISSNRSSANPSLPPEITVSLPPEELDITEIHELPAVEPVGSELYTARVAGPEGEEGQEGVREEWPLPLSPLPLLFALSEMRDERAGVVDSPKHETFYHP